MDFTMVKNGDHVVLLDIGVFREPEKTEDACTVMTLTEKEVLQGLIREEGAALILARKLGVELESSGTRVS